MLIRRALVDPLLPLVGFESRRSRIALTGSKRPFEGIDECAPSEQTPPLLRVVIRTRK